MKLGENESKYQPSLETKVPGSNPEVVLVKAPILCQFHLFHPFFL
jgi:hypothetical protein